VEIHLIKQGQRKVLHIRLREKWNMVKIDDPPMSVMAE
jgi:hypothetical protein